MSQQIYRGFEIKPKRDFGSGKGFLIDGKWVKEGWVVCYGPGMTLDMSEGGKHKDRPTNMDVEGCNAMPGACWFQTVEEAKHGIDVLIQVGGEHNSDAFWDIMQPFNYEVGKPAPDRLPSLGSSTITKGKHWATINDAGIVTAVGHDGKPPGVWA